MKEQLLEDVKKKVFDFSGIIISAPQRETLIKYIKEKANQSGISVDNFCQNLTPGTAEMDDLINQVTVNETYFYREARQFNFLAKNIFPKYAGKKMNIWSGACSTGEEAISLLTMALSFGIDATVYATDIDDKVIAFLKKGVYSNFSFREDGNEYHNLLDPYCVKNDKIYTFNSALIDRIKVFKYNLTSNEDLPFKEKMDLIFLRNVFIYFDIDTRKKVCSKVCDKLNSDGLLFFSMSEVGTLDNRVLPDYIAKVNYNDVYYFIHKTAVESLSSQNIITRFETYGEKPKVNQLSAIIAAKSAERKTKNSTARTRILSQNSNNETKKMDVGNIVKTETSDIHKIFTAVSECINKKDFENARKHIATITEIENKVFKYFFSGYIEYHDDNKTEAEKLFSSAEMIKNNFWPAYFYHGLVLKDIGKDEKSKYCFKKCKEILDALKDSNPYNFILDSFSPSYIYNLCSTLQNA